MSEQPDVIRQLHGVLEALQQEWKGMQIAGRAWSPEERRRSDQISRAAHKLREGLEILITEVLPTEKSRA